MPTRHQCRSSHQATARRIAYLRAYAPSQLSTLRAVIYQFAPRRSGEHACAFLQGWQGKPVCDDFSG